MKNKGCTKTRGLHRSAHASNTANAGSFTVNSNNTPSNANTNYGSHLCYDIDVFVDHANKAKKYKNKKGFGTEREEDWTQSKVMKRINNIYKNIISIENLELADNRARKGKLRSYGVHRHDINREGNILSLHRQLKEKAFSTSPYDTFYIYKPKKRLIYRLPYYPDRIVHHAVMNIMEPIWKEVFTADTYSCIRGKGIHACQYKIQNDLRSNPEETTFCLKIDIKKFYPSIDHEILKKIIRKKIKDEDLLWLMDNIIDSAPGVPIGNYLSQYFANMYLAYFDHWIKEKRDIKYYYRYADDIVVLHHSKQFLHALLADIKIYLAGLKLTVKENYQVFPVKSRGVDFVGYVFYHTHTLLRKSIKKQFARKIKRNAPRESLMSYWGWSIHADTKNLIKKLNFQP